MNFVARRLLYSLLPLALATVPAAAELREERTFSLSLPPKFRGDSAAAGSERRAPPLPTMPRFTPPDDPPWYSVLPMVGKGKAEGERGLSFGVRPGKRPKATARFRF